MSGDKSKIQTFNIVVRVICYEKDYAYFLPTKKIQAAMNKNCKRVRLNFEFRRNMNMTFLTENYKCSNIHLLDYPIKQFNQLRKWQEE